MERRGLILLLVLCLIFCGCSQGEGTQQESVQNDEAAKDAAADAANLLTVGDHSLPFKVARLFVLSQKHQYETAFGSSIWQVNYQDSTFEETLKDGFRTHIALMFTASCLAADQEVNLSAEEEKTLREAAHSCYDSMKGEDRELLEITEPDVEEALRMYVLAKKVYRQITGSVELDLSEDETRVIRLQEIRISTEGLEGIEKDQKLTLAAEALNLLEAGEDFNTVAEKYSETGTAIYSASRDTLTGAETKAAFALATDENSPVITLPGAYVIFHCVDSYDKAASELHRMELLQQMEDTGFKEKLNIYLSRNALTWNETNWAAIDFSGYKGPADVNLYSVYDQYFGEDK